MIKHDIPRIGVFTAALEKTSLSQLSHPLTRYDIAYLARECHVARLVDGDEAGARCESVAARAVEKWIRSDGSISRSDIPVLVAVWRVLASPVDLSEVLA